LNELYNNKEYKRALPLFEKLLLSDSTNARLRLGAGICHLELQQLDAARTQFLSIIEAKDFRLQHQANWYMALTYLKTGNVEAAQKYLNPIVVNSKADHHEEAMELMERLKQS
jgi:Flp pilus assembly protein TadD, contains TPR repeats